MLGEAATSAQRLLNERLADDIRAKKARVVTKDRLMQRERRPCNRDASGGIGGPEGAGGGGEGGVWVMRGRRMGWKNAIIFYGFVFVNATQVRDVE